MRQLAVGTRTITVALLSTTLLLGPVAASYASDTGKIIAGLLIAGLIYKAIDKDDSPARRDYDAWDDTHRYDREGRWDEAGWYDADGWDSGSRYGDHDAWDGSGPRPASDWRRDEYDRRPPERIPPWADDEYGGIRVTERDCQYYINRQVASWKNRHPFDGTDEWFRSQDRYAGRVAEAVVRFLHGEGPPPPGFYEVIAEGRLHAGTRVPDRPQPNMAPPPSYLRW